jgi:membrane associated rhomboid family serine protease
MSRVRYNSGEGELIPIIVLIIINVVVYLAINIASYSGASIVEYLALSRATVMAEPWTILTSMFTHMDFMHLLANMITLYFYGSFLNRITGTPTFLWIYFGGGLLSALAVLLLSDPMSFTIGASGAVFALGGALAVLVPNLKVFIFPIPVPMPLWVAILIGFLLLAFIPGVSWQGHLGGLLFGLAAGWYLRGRLRVIL